MVSEMIELFAEMQGKSVDEIIKNRTKKSPQELSDQIDQHLNHLLPSEMTVEEYESTYARGEAAAINQGTYKQREFAIRRFEEWYTESEREYLKRETIEDFLKQSNYAKSTLETYYWQIIKFVTEEFNKTIENQFREANKEKYLKLDKDEKESALGEGARPITRDEKELLIEETSKPKIELTVRILWQTGLRASELANLKVEQVNLEEQKIEEVRTAKREDHTRTLSFNLKLRNELRRWINVERNKYTQAGDSPYLLPTHKSEQIYPRNLTKSIRDLAERAGIQETNDFQKGGERAEITVHSFRKAFGLNRLKAGANVRQVQLLLGHSDIRTTQHYLDLDEETLEYSPKS